MIQIYLLVSTFIVFPILNGLALSILWGWFVTQTFGVPSISIPVAIGLVMTVQLLIFQDHNEEKYENMDEKELLTRVIVHSFVSPIASIVLGWIVYQFV